MSSTLFGINAQIDLGNFAVGIGTLAVAVSSAVAIYKQSRSKVSEFRKEWLENLRAHLAEFDSVQVKMRLAGQRKTQCKARGDDEGAQKHFEAALGHAERSRYLKSYVSMMLNPKETAHSILLRCMAEMHRKSMLKIRGKDDEEGASESRDLPAFLDQARSVLKIEWDRVKKN